MDTACVELRLDNGTLIAIDTIAVENQVADNMYERSELDYLVYNDPLKYVKLLLSGKLKEHLLENTDYTPLADLR